MLLPIPRDRLPARLALLLGGLVLYGASTALIVRAGLGAVPWDVLHQGLSRTLGLQIGTWSIIIGALLLVAWVPLRQRPGLGTLANVVVLGLALNATLDLVPPLHGWALQVGALAAGVALNGVATGAYIGAGMGPGPRDGLSTAIAARGHSLRLVRTVVEVTVVVVGVLLGGHLGIGTVVYALAIGPLMHLTVPMLRLRSPAARPSRARAARRCPPP